MHTLHIKLIKIFFTVLLPVSICCISLNFGYWLLDLSLHQTTLTLRSPTKY